MVRLLAVLVLLLPLTANANRFLALSDIHFDPLRDPALTDKLAQAPATEWADLLAGGAPSGFGKDTDWTLLTQTLDAMRQAEPHPDFILMPGDFLAHKLDTRFKQNGTRSDAALLDFEAKTLQVIVQQTQQRFPGVPLFPVLGNNDDACGDYRADDADATMSADLPLVRAMLGTPQSTAFETDWARLGSYDVALEPGVRLIAFDDTFFSRHFKPCDGAADLTPDMTLLAWLHDHLAAARAAGAKVWLMMHIPPGQDVYATLIGAACPAAPETMWRETDRAAYSQLVEEFGDIIAAQFSGHTHMAEFRLVGADGFVIGIPGVSPIYLQNPAFDLITYRPDGALTNRVTMAFSNFADAVKSPAPVWKPADFAAAWSISALNAATLGDVARRLTDRPPGSNPDLARYLLDYSTGHAGVWEAQHLDPVRAARDLACTARDNPMEAFRDCFCPP